MNERAFRCSSTSVLIFALLLAVLPGLAAADEVPRLSPQAREAFEEVASPQAKGCRPCALAHQSCSATCFSLAEKGGMAKCLMACDNAAATCTCEQAVTLRSEDVVSWEWPSQAKAACHGNVSCQPAYPSCGSWSSYSDCGDPLCGIYRWCGDCGDIFGCWDLATRQPRERFRVCYNQYGQSCTEWETANFLVACGC
jgi:hypothetical protein